MILAVCDECSWLLLGQELGGSGLDASLDLRPATPRLRLSMGSGYAVTAGPKALRRFWCAAGFELLVLSVVESLLVCEKLVEVAAKGTETSGSRW